MRRRLSPWPALVAASALLACGPELPRPLDHRAFALSTLAFQDGVSPDATYAGTRDTTLDSVFPTTVEGASTLVDFDSIAPSNGLLLWDVSAIPPGSTVTAATIELLLVTRARTPASMTYELRSLEVSWAEAQATWQQRLAGTPWGTPGATGDTDHGADIVASGAVPASTGPWAIPLADAGVALVQRWVDSPSTNFGIWASGPAIDVEVASREATTASQRPRLVVDFVAAAADAGTDAGADAGMHQDGGGEQDAGIDAGPDADAGLADAGVEREPRAFNVGCDCGSSGAALPLGLLWLVTAWAIRTATPRRGPPPPR